MAAALAAARTHLPRVIRSARTPNHNRPLSTNPITNRHTFDGSEEEGRHYVLVHRAGSGAWCWYRTVAMLQEAGEKVTTMDLGGSGADPRSHRDISCFAEYTQPLVDVLASIPQSEKVVLVGHGSGGLSLAHASDLFPQKIAVSVYVAALMLPGGLQSEEDFHLLSGGINNEDSSMEIYWRGEQARSMFYHLSSVQDVVLAAMLDRPLATEVLRSAKFVNTNKGYQTIPRVYIRTEQDRAIKPLVQAAMIGKSQPAEVHSICSDHSPFFSAPDMLHLLLLSIGSKYCPR